MKSVSMRPIVVAAVALGVVAATPSWAQEQRESNAHPVEAGNAGARKSAMHEDARLYRPGEPSPTDNEAALLNQGELFRASGPAGVTGDPVVRLYQASAPTDDGGDVVDDGAPVGEFKDAAEALAQADAIRAFAEEMGGPTDEPERQERRAALLPTATASGFGGLDMLDRNEVDNRLKPQGPDLLGDSIDLDTGAIVFEHVDAAIPGNSDLEVAIRRTRSQDTLSTHNRHLMGDWKLEIPSISMMIAETDTWKAARCSTSSKPGPVSYLGTSFAAEDYWNGLSLSIPGEGDRYVLDNPGSYGPAKWPISKPVKATVGHWMITCISSVSGGGEGFVATAPNGDKYTFDKLVEYKAPDAHKGAAHLPRKRVAMLASTVTDASGNSVSYLYDNSNRPIRIESNDLRAIDIAYVPGADRVGSVTANGRQWVYGYAQIGGVYVLESVTLPDQRKWVFDLFALSALHAVQGSTCKSPDGDISVIHPDGVKGVFSLAETTHGRTNVPNQTVTSASCGAEDIKMARTVDRISVVKKELEHWFYDTTTNTFTKVYSTWTFDYQGGPGKFVSQTDATLESDLNKRTIVIDPLGRKIVSHFRRLWGAGEGALAKEEIFATASSTAPVQTVAYGYFSGEQFGVAGLDTTENVHKLQVPIYLAFAKIDRGGDLFTTTYSYDLVSSSGTYSYGAPLEIKQWSSVSPAPRVTTTTYAHNKTAWILALPSVVKRNNVVFDTYAYDGAGRLVTAKEFGVTQATLSYYTSGAEAGRPKSHKDAKGYLTYFYGYKRGIPGQVKDANGFSAYYTTDNNGWITSFKNRRGYSTAYQYDSMGRITKIIPSKTSGAATDTDIAYSTTGAYWSRIETRGDEQAATYFDGYSRPFLTARLDSTGVSDPIYEHYRYNALGLTIFESFATPTFDSTINNGVDTTYDALLRVTKRRDNVAPYAETKFAYGSGNAVYETDPDGSLTTRHYSAYGTPDNGDLAFIKEKWTQTVLERDVWGKLTKLRQYGNLNGINVDQSQFFYYDAKHRLCRMRTPEGSDAAYEYDNASNLTAYAKGLPVYSGCQAPPSATRTTIAYDKLHRPTLVNYPTGTADITSGYDKNGNVLKKSRGGAVWTYLWNDQDLLTDETLKIDSRTYKTAYAYNALGNVASQTYPSGLVVDYAPDALGRPLKATAPLLGTSAALASNIAWHVNGAVRSLDYANGYKLTQTVYARRLLASRKITKSGTQSTTPMNVVYAYTKSGRINGITEATIPGQNRTYAYDEAGRLVASTGP